MNQYSRKEKLRLLKALQSGSLTISDLLPPTVEMWLIKDGLYYEHTKGLTLTKAAFEQYKATAKNKVLFVPDDRFAFET